MDRLNKIFNAAPIDIEVGVSDLYIYTKEEFEDAQIGYRVDTDNNIIENWVGDNFYVVGNDSCCGDPFIVDISDPNLPIYYMFHDDWSSLTQITESFEEFVDTIELIRKYNLSEDSEVEELLDQIRDYAYNVEYWEDLINIAHDFFSDDEDFTYEETDTIPGQEIEDEQLNEIEPLTQEDCINEENTINLNCKHCNIDDNKIIYKGKYWTLYFTKQDYLGRCILATNQHLENFSNLSDLELISFRNMITAVENTLKDLYGCTMLNWCCNMNNAYSKDSQTSPHVHIHIRPRYKNPVTVNNITYTDNEFGSHYDRFAQIQFDEETTTIIFNQIKETFCKYYSED